MGEAKRKTASGNGSARSGKGNGGSRGGGEVSPPEALEYAVQLHRSGKLDVAETLYGRIVAAAPDYADAHHFYGILKHQQGKSLEAIAMIRKAIDIAPEEPGMHNNLGNILLQVDRHDLAVQAYEMTIVLQPDNTDARSNLGVALRALGRLDEAEEVYREAIALNPEHREAWDNLGRLLAQRGRAQESIEAHAKALELEPGNAATRRYLVAAYAATDQYDRALVILRQWLKDEPDSPSAKHLVAAISGENVPERASDRYVESMFDGFAQSFDSKLAKLEYRAPALVGGAVERACGEPRSALDILDAGCGTGLCGPHLKSYARRLVGIDLSSKMLDQARARGEYDELLQAELTAYLRDHPAAFDIVASADTLCYFGALGPVIASAASCLRSGGRLVFTVEEERGPADIRLNPHGRYSHHRGHVSASLAEAGLDAIAIEEVELRMERGEPVHGLLVTAGKR